MESENLVGGRAGIHRRPGADKLLPGPGVILSRGLIYLSILFVAAAIAWMWKTRADVVVQARGQLVVKGEPVQITVQNAGLVVDVPVRIGQHVAQGELLLKLDAFEHESEIRRVSNESEALRVEASRHRQHAEALTRVRGSLEAEKETAARSTELVKDQMQRLEVLQRNAAAAPSELQAKRLEMLEAQARQARIDGEIERNRAEASESQQLASEADARRQGLAARLDQLREHSRRSSVCAPVAGKVTQLALTHPGSVIDASRPAVTILPDDLPLMACIRIPNESMRRLQRGLGVRVEFDALPREDYGCMEGRLTEIDPDAGEDGNYKAWVSLDRPELHVAALAQQLKPGLQMNVHILVEQRSILNLLLKPLKRLKGPIDVRG